MRFTQIVMQYPKVLLQVTRFKEIT